MSKTISIALVLLVGSSLSQLAQAQSEPAGSNNVETVLTLPSGGNTENIGQAPDGAIYITGLTDRILWKVRPDGHADNFFTLPSATAFVGVVASKDEVVLGIFQRPFQRPAPADGQRGGGPQLDMSNVGSQIVVLDKAGKVKANIDGVEGQFFNGIAMIGKQSYLITDTNGTTLLHLDTAKKKIEPWLKDDLLMRMNGIKVHNGWVYIASQDKIYRVQVDSNGKPKGSVMLFAQGVRTDDFAIAPDGTLYIPTAMTMMKVSPKGEVSKLLDNVPNGASAWVTQDGKWLYWSTRAGPSKLLRVAL